MEAGEPDDGISTTAFLLVVTLAVAVAGVAVIAGFAVVGSFVYDVAGLFGAGPPPDEIPMAEFDFDETDEGVRVSHAGGDSVAADRLSVRIIADDGTTVRNGSWQRLAPGTPDRVREGDRLVVREARPGWTVQVLWRGGDRPVSLDRHYVAESSSESSTTNS